VYISLPDTSAACATWTGLPPLPTGWSYVCSTPANFRRTDGTGWIPVNFDASAGGSPFAVLPVDPVNNASHHYTYVTGGSWVLRALTESQRAISQAAADGGTSDAAFETGTNLLLGAGIFPGGWTRLPTGQLVMQWEAKYDRNGDGIGDTAAAAACLADSGLGLDWRDIGCNTASNIVSTPQGAPIVHITHTQAVSACAAIGARLLNNQTEWMPLVRDAERVALNWSTGVVGTGCLFRGNVGVADACGYDGADPEHGVSRDRRAQFTLSNDAKIFDISGNVWEHVMRNAANAVVNNTPTDGGVLGWRWIEHTAIVGYGDLSYDEVRPSNTAWNSAHGMGRVFTHNGAVVNRVLLRGGAWPYGAPAGGFTLALNLDAAAQSYATGFRCAR
jgi:formylglycine-generating enzyme required for sulfatase activity